MLATLKGFFRKLSRGEIHYIFGRFNVVRRTYGTVRGRFRRSIPSPGTLVLSDVDVAKACRELHETGLALGFNLPHHVVKDIRDYATHQACRSSGSDEKFMIGDVRDGRTPGGQPVALAHVDNPTGCPSLVEVMGDERLRSVVAYHLGYEPPNVDPALYWSPVGNFTDDQRRELAQTIDYHFDVHGWNFVYAHFYLTDTDERSGAHVAVVGSHRRKPWRMLLGSARASEEAILDAFGPTRILTIVGPAGTGFVEDTSCFHRALPPTERPRLMLQLRFH